MKKIVYNRARLVNKVLLGILLFEASFSWAQVQNMPTLNEPFDVSPDFSNYLNTYYLADNLAAFDPETASGLVEFKRHEYSTRMAFNNMLSVLKPVTANEFPDREYEASPRQEFSLEFVSPRTVRIRMKSGPVLAQEEGSLMLVNGIAPVDKSWKYKKTTKGHLYSSAYGSVEVSENPWKVDFYDASGKWVTGTAHNSDYASTTYTPVLPFSYVRRASDYSRSFAAVFNLSPEEKIFGLGESYTQLNKRGQKVILFVDDANGIQNEAMYKPIPFFMSSNGYGIFMHTSAPVTCDFGKYFNGVQSLLMGDETLDLFVFLGDPKTILDEYTNLTGKAPMPPLWSFGFWMSRITYFSEEDGRAVAGKLRDNKVPCDVIHFDTGWFETDWRCDYQFAKSRFTDAAKMISDFKAMGIHTCLWQLPYFVPKNGLTPEIIEKGLYVKNPKGNLPYEDAVLDFSNPETVKWYQGKIAGLLKLGVGAIKVDFGEAAPLNGIYASGKTGFYEHNLYPLRYNKAVSDITQEMNGERIIWARSTWAGSQRYPLHWGGDPANSNSSMSACLRGGLSFGLSGFSFWSHDIGGFVQKCPEELYRRWTPFGMLSSHARSHGTPPKEPWEYSPEFLDGFREATNMRYRLMPYIYAQAKQCTEKGLPMVRALLLEFPDDPGAWLIDNQYLFGSDILVAPLFNQGNSREVYLPGNGKWIDYQTGKVYSKGWNRIEAGTIPVIMLVRDGAVIPHIKLAQSTKFMDWGNIDLKAFSSDKELAKGWVCLPENNQLCEIELVKKNNRFELKGNPVKGKVNFKIIQ